MFAADLDRRVGVKIYAAHATNPTYTLGDELAESEIGLGKATLTHNLSGTSGGTRYHILPYPETAVTANAHYSIAVTAKTPAVTTSTVVSEATSTRIGSGPITSSQTVSGTWTGATTSLNRPGHYSQLYRFTTNGNFNAVIDLASTAADPYLYVWPSGPLAGLYGYRSRYEDDNSGTGNNARVGGAAGTEDALRIRANDPTYYIEATTADAGQAGAFTLTVTLSTVQIL